MAGLHNGRLILRYIAAGGPLAVHQSVPLQFRQGPLHGVGVDARLHSQIPHGGQPLSRRERTGDDAGPDLPDELGVDRGIIGKLPVHEPPPCTLVLSN